MTFTTQEINEVVGGSVTNILIDGAAIVAFLTMIFVVAGIFTGAL